MVLDVDLKCSDCYKKVKKILCKIPEIRDQEYEVDKNKVKISVVCCSPEKIRDKLCYKGGSSIQKIEVVVEKPKDSKPSDKDKPKDAGKPKAAKGDAPPPAKKSEPKSEVAKMVVEPVQGYPQMYPPTYPVIGYGHECYGGGYGAPPQPSGYGYGYGYANGYGHGHGYDHGYNGNASRNDYFSEENPQGCSVM